ncbi:MAG: hypothetical protein QOI75_6879, partial [Pseudonocardiales bacterium]|nr:hypothetical protein [Pseudonocardiales bacterium]
MAVPPTEQNVSSSTLSPPAAPSLYWLGRADTADHPRPRDRTGMAMAMAVNGSRDEGAD